MDKKTAIAGLLIAMLIIGVFESVGAVNENSCKDFDCDIDAVKEIGGEWIPDELFSSGEEVGVRCQEFPKKDTITIYIFTNRGWTDGQGIPTGDAKVSGTVETNPSQGDVLWTWQTSPGDEGLYDILVDVDQDGEYDKQIDAVLSRSTNVIAFEVTPEMNTITLMGAGLLSLIGFAGIRRRK